MHHRAGGRARTGAPHRRRRETAAVAETRGAPPASFAAACVGGRLLDVAQQQVRVGERPMDRAAAPQRQVGSRALVETWQRLGLGGRVLAILAANQNRQHKAPADLRQPGLSC